ncbi:MULTISPECIES: hypothetical protein [Paenibacillus]|uniref:hypothetical protein n=1 Tax=Paenibacillus TaxID=44249 RepID=UPI0022B8EBB7|nr:hypothetical protein [Paenibacillus caseinilyticus]MCZ8521891.1 hypothetical protein [Paenibacillus caseinilyticus]
MNIPAGSCVGVLYYQEVKGSWTVGVHNGRARNASSDASVLALGHVSGTKEFNQALPPALLFYPTISAYKQALKNPPDPKKEIPFGVKITVQITAKSSGHACIAFLQNGAKRNKANQITVVQTAHNGKFIRYTSPNGKVYTNVAPAVESIKKDPGGVLEYVHYNLISLGSGRYRLKEERTYKPNITALRILK